MTSERQLKLWVKGIAVHNPTRDECCPDFSCCQHIMADRDVRERFCQAVQEDDEDTMHQMLGMFLGAAVAHKNVYIAGL